MTLRAVPAAQTQKLRSDPRAVWGNCLIDGYAENWDDRSHDDNDRYRSVALPDPS
jgi:hypothetical protein